MINDTIVQFRFPSGAMASVAIHRDPPYYIWLFWGSGIGATITSEDDEDDPVQRLIKTAARAGVVLDARGVDDMLLELDLAGGQPNTPPVIGITPIRTPED